VQTLVWEGNAGAQAVEIRSAVDAEQHGLAVEDERAAPIAERSL
jgi:hypothetical protein